MAKAKTKITHRTRVGKTVKLQSIGPMLKWNGPSTVWASPGLVADWAKPHVERALAKAHLIEDPLCELEIATELLMSEVDNNNVAENEGIYYLARCVQRHVRETRAALDKAFKHPEPDKPEAGGAK